jgi:hypothetical protein
MAHPTYYGIDAVALMLAVVLAAAILMLGSLLIPEVADLMPPALSGAHRTRGAVAARASGFAQIQRSGPPGWASVRTTQLSGR